MAFVSCIEIWQENDNHSEQLYSEIPYHLFNIELDFRYISSLNPEATLETFNQSVIFSRDMFLSQEYGPNMVAPMFANTGESPEFLQTVIVPIILSSASEIDSEPVNFGRKVIKLIIKVLVKVNTDNEIDQVIDESLNTLNFKPASSSSIQSLKRMKWDDEGHLPFKKRRRLLEGLSSKKECAICLDEFLEGDEVASMPCAHVYHDGCIVKWLETSHLCPLCRYQMPS
ncbi:hypothetical protein CRYUN_Cryun35bG0068200 [Craigia yunnanensis]